MDCAWSRQINTFHAAGMSRRQSKNVTKVSKNFNILEFFNHIWNHHEKYIQISTSMPGIGSLIREIAVRNFRIVNNFG